MPNSEVTQRLAAILAADVAGYSRLMADDEPATISTINDCRTVFRQAIESNGGRVVDMAGDSVLAVFPTATGAAKAAIESQDSIQEINAALPDARQMLFRVGLNLGEIHEQDDGTVYGDGVNVAARLETLAVPGGICISAKMQSEIHNRLDLNFEDIGAHEVKNIVEPIRVFRILPNGSAESRGAKSMNVRRLAKVAGAVAAALLISLAVWHWLPPDLETSDSEGVTVSDPVLTLPVGPSIAVLPFENLSDDPEQGYFADGMTADIITDLSHLRGLMVIAQGSTSQYKGRSVDVREIGRHLGVRHLMEGGVRRDGERVRINVRLIDAQLGAEVWAQRYDRALGDIFAVQDEIGRKIVAELDVHLTEGEAARTWRQTTSNPEAYDYFLRARDARLRMTRENVALAKRLSERALELDPEFAMAMVVLGRAHRSEAYSGWSDSASESYEKSLHWINRAIEINPSLGEAYNTLGDIYFEYLGDPDLAIDYLRKAVELDPNSARNIHALAWGLIRYDEPEEGLEYAKRALRLNPNPPGYYYGTLGCAHLFAGRPQQAIAPLREATVRMPDFMWGHMFLTIAYVRADRVDDARRQAKEILRIKPSFIAADDPGVKGYRNPTIGQDLVSALHEAGLK